VIISLRYFAFGVFYYGENGMIVDFPFMSFKTAGTNNFPTGGYPIALNLFFKIIITNIYDTLYP